MFGFNGAGGGGGGGLGSSFGYVITIEEISFNTSG